MIDQRIGAKVRSRRELLRMDIAAVAAPLGLSAASMRRLEDGIERISASQLQSLCAALRMTPRTVFADVGG